MQRLVAIAILGAAGAAAGCRLGPLVDDQPGASANVLPQDAMVPSIATNSDLTNQIAVNDGLDDDTLMANNNVIVRGTGGFTADGMPVQYWAFGEADLAPTPIYVFGHGDPMTTSFVPLTEHPPLVEVVPGDIDYEPIHTIYRVAVTGKYAGQRITTLSALSDAIDLGLIEAPVAIKVFVNWPIVRPGLKLEVGPGTASISPTPVYAHGYVADSFPLGGALGMQPTRGILPTSQVTFMRGANQANYDLTRPIFQATIPTAPAQMDPNYTPLSVVVNVDLAGAMMPSDIHKDSELFMRSPDDGSIVSTTAAVARFVITDQLTDLQIQFKEGFP